MTTRRAFLVSLAALGAAPAIARNPDGQFDDSPNRKWFEDLRLPNGMSCCGAGDAHLTDNWTIERDGSAHVVVAGKTGVEFRFIVPRDHVLMDKSLENPTGRGILFADDRMVTAYCFVPAVRV